MREHKYRLWDKIKKVMVSGDNYDYGFELYLDGSMTIISRESGCDWQERDQKDFVLMEYTGLNDKNGAEAFFDDVVTLDGNPCKWWVAQDDFGIPVFVNLTKEHTTFDQIDFKDYFMSQGKHSFEIITNIHESPDLLKGGDNG